MDKRIKVESIFGHMDQPEQDDGLLYHYCSMNTLVSIVENQCVWFSDLNYMNDPSEIFLKNINFPGILLDTYQKEPFDFEFEHNGVKNSFEDYLTPSIIENTLMKGGQHNNSLFAFCLSDKCNDLSQWRLYGDNGKGVCLGFKKAKIEKFIKENEGFRLCKVEYFNNPNDLVNKIAKTILEKIKTMYDNNDFEGLNQYRLGYLRDLVNEWAKYKVSDYSLESETRIIYKLKTSIISNINASQLSADDKKINYRLKDNNLTAYIPIKLENLGLETISLGPINYNSKYMINLLLGKNNIDIKNYKIYKSNIPYRD